MMQESHEMIARHRAREGRRNPRPEFRSGKGSSFEMSTVSRHPQELVRSEDKREQYFRARWSCSVHHASCRRSSMLAHVLNGHEKGNR